jgi:site-specific recombinase XerD
MIDAMRVRGFSVRTHQSYLAAVTELARYYRRSPDQVNVDELRAFFLYLATERDLSGASCRLYLNAIRFLYLQVLGWAAFDVPFQVPKKAQRIPELLTRREVGRILSACANPKHRMLLATCYGCGLRVSELVTIKVRHIDGERRLLRIEQGKGAKDRQVIVSEALLHRLRHYWRRYRPVDWLFSGQDPIAPMGIATAQKVFTAAKRRAEVGKVGGIHSLRHAYATHQLEAGRPVHQLQRLLGHQNIHSTLRYVHWVPDYREGHSTIDLIAALGGGS